MSNQNKDELIGKTLGQYEILEEIGRGGMATVYRAKQQSMNRTVAVKVLPRHLLHDPSFYERFEREVDVIAHLEHPHILPIYDYGQSEGIPYIAMRFLGGGSMESMVRRGPPKLETIETPLNQIAQALDYAHLQGIIHRDLKPGNIMLDESGNAYLSDFGIARVLGSDLTGSMIIGTPAYMSPEQANGLPIDGRSDIYSLGIVLFELITGSEPYSAETPMAVLLKHINEPVPPISDYRDDVPPAVEAVIEKATAKDPDYRFSSAGDMANAFERALRGEMPPLETRAGVATKAAASSPAAPSVQGAGHPTPTYPGMAQTPTPGPMPAVQMGTDPNISGTGQFGTGQFEQKRGPSIGVLLTIVSVVLIVVVGGIVGLTVMNQDEGGNPPPVDSNVVPTPFLSANTVRDRLYTVSIPQGWIPSGGFYDESESGRLVHIWRSTNDLDSYVALEMWDGNEMPDEAAFRATIEEYESLHVTDQPLVSLVDETIAEDGTIRRSYYTDAYDGSSSSEFSPGQLDIYYMNKSPYLVAVHMFATHESGNEHIRTFQRILDSLRIHPEGAPA